MPEIKFPCNQCGACCRNVKGVEGFTEPVKEDGSCSHLREDNSCAIYENRPLICRVDEFYEKNYKHRMTKTAWYNQNIHHCNKFMDQEGLPKDKRLTPIKYDKKKKEKASPSENPKPETTPPTDCAWCGADLGSTFVTDGVCSGCRAAMTGVWP